MGRQQTVKATLEAKANMSQLLPTELESTYVHDVYDNIASHFSSTRYKVLSPRSLLPCPVPLSYACLSS